MLVRDLSPGFANSDVRGSGSLWQIQPGGAISQVGAYTGITALASDGSTLNFIKGNELYALPEGGAPALILDAGATGCTLADTLKIAGARAYFPVSCPATGRELWVTNGTTPGTFSLGDLWPGARNGFSGMVASLGDTLFFAGSTEASGAELWKTDGTALGTVMVKDILPGFGGSVPSVGAAAAGVVWFAATDATHGYELWRSDGTSNGTVLAGDLEPGVASSSPDHLVAGLGGVLFTAAASAQGREPHFVGPFVHLRVSVMSSTATPVAGADFTLTATVTNDGPGIAQDVELAIHVPTGLAVSLATPIQGTCDAFGCSFGSVAAGATVSAEYTVEPLATGVHATGFSVVMSTADLLPPAPDAVVTVTASASADLAMQASVMPASVVVGETATITATLVNNGPSPASGVSIDVAASGATLTATIVLTPAAVGTIMGSVSVSAAEMDPVAANDSASVSLIVTAPTGATGSTGPIATSGETETPETPDSPDTGETPADEPPPQKRGCACSEGSRPDLFALLLAAAALARPFTRRRRVGERARNAGSGISGEDRETANEER